MRIAFLSDIHGNLPALEAVWAEVEAAAPEFVVDLGDIASGPLWPRETVQWLMARAAAEPARWVTIAGNHERQVLAPEIDRMGASDAFAARALGPAERAWLAALPAAARLAGGVHLCHGTPGSDLVYWMETVVPGYDGRGQTGVRPATAEELRERAGAFAGDDGTTLVACGHTHVPRLMTIPGGPLVLNPGSIGLQAYDDTHPHDHLIENGSPHARWALVEHDRHGDWRVELRATRYDWHAAADRAEANGRGDWADALRSGFMGRTEAVARRA